jgi:16S rRNA processing protein RimM
VQLVVGRIARAHGVGGEVSVEVRTDDPDVRFAVGSRLETDPAERGPLTVQRARWHTGRLLVRFDEVVDRDSAEALRNTMLVVDSATSAPLDDDNEFWDHDLIGLRVLTLDGTELGRVADVLHPPGSDVLAVQVSDDREVLIPFVRSMVPEVDVRRGHVVVDPPDGLLEL